jgi:hypothetical protein
MKTKTPTKKKPPAVTKETAVVKLYQAALQQHIARGGNPNDGPTHFDFAKAMATTKKGSAVTRENGRPTINAEFVDDLFAETIQNLMALQVVWEKISLKEELK